MRTRHCRLSAAQPHPFRSLLPVSYTHLVVVCVNLLDEAKKKKIHIDLDELSLQLGVPVVGASARAGIGLTELMDEVEKVAFDRQKTYPPRLDYGPEVEQAIARLLPIVKPHTLGKLNARWT